MRAAGLVIQSGLKMIAIRPDLNFYGGHDVPPLYRSTPKKRWTGTGCASLGSYRLSLILVRWCERGTEADGTIHHVDDTRCKLWRNAADIPLSKVSEVFRIRSGQMRFNYRHRFVCLAVLPQDGL